MVFECVRQAAVRRLKALAFYLAICDCCCNRAYNICKSYACGYKRNS